jgi:hypothetical protein
MRATVTTVLLALGAPLCAPKSQDQAPATREMSDAEKEFRDGWWAENGRNDMPAALQRYLAAAQAAGPVQLRARALLHAGVAQQRMGKVESAIGTFRQLLQQHADQPEVTEPARVHLQELTAVDLRQNYDEWYERRLFGEEVQLKILERIESLAGKLGEPNGADGARVQALRKIEGEILVFGKGAVPALRKTCESPHEALAERAVQLLFQLGVVPPASALARCTDWVNEASNWERLLAAPPAGAAQAGRTPQGELLRTAAAGRAALAAALLSEQPPRFLVVESPALSAIAVALLRSGDGRVAEFLAAATSDKVSLRVREAFEEALLETPLPLTAADWIRLGKEALRHRLSVHALRMAARSLKAGDGDSLDAALLLLESAPKQAAEECANALTGGLEGNVSPLHVPWTAARLRRLFLAAAPWQEACLSELAWTLRRQAGTRAVVAEALLGDPVAVRKAWPVVRNEQAVSDPLARHVAIDRDDIDAVLLCARWNLAMAEFLTGAWPKWDDAQRVAALQLLPALLGAGERVPLRTFVERAEAGASEVARKELEAVRKLLE